MDPDTRAVLGAKVAASLAAAYAVDEIVLPRHPHPDMDAVNGVIAKTQKANALIAVGSGSVNDITQICRASDRQALCRLRHRALDERLHLGIAAITENGLKKSLPASAAARASSSTST